MTNRSISPGSPYRSPRRRAAAGTGDLARILVLLLFLGLCNPLSAGGCLEPAGDPTDPGGTAQGSPRDPATGDRPGEARPDPSAGQKAYVDPQTGELLDRPSPGEPPEAPPEPPAVMPDIPVQVRPDGTVVADIGNRFITDLNVEIVDGRIVTCHRAVEAEGEPERGESPQELPDDGDGR